MAARLRNGSPTGVRQAASGPRGHRFIRCADKQAQNTSLALPRVLRIVSILVGSDTHPWFSSASREPIVALALGLRLLRHAVERAGERVGRFHTISVRDLPAQALVHCDTSHAAIARSHRTLAEAQAVLIGTPIYKAAYSGLLKLVSRRAARWRRCAAGRCLALATGGSRGPPAGTRLRAQAGAVGAGRTHA